MLQKVVLLATYIMARSVPPTYNVSGDPPGALPGDPSGGPSGSLSGGPSGGSACRRLRMTNTDSTIKWLRSALQRSVRTPNEECSACLFLSLRGPSGSPPGALRGLCRGLENTRNSHSVQQPILASTLSVTMGICITHGHAHLVGSYHATCRVDSSNQIGKRWRNAVLKPKS